VEIVGSGQAYAALEIRYADGSDVSGLAVRGAGAGIYASGGMNVVVRDVWIHDTAGIGLVVDHDIGASTAQLRGALVENAHAIGVWIRGASATIEASAVRGTKAADGTARGISVELDAERAVRASVALRGSVVERNEEQGIFVAGADLVADGVVIRDTQPQPKPAFSGRGMTVTNQPGTTVRGSAEVRRTVVERNRELGILASGSDLVLDAATFRDMLPLAAGQRGWGVALQAAPMSEVAAAGKITRTKIERCQEAGVVVISSQATIEQVSVRDMAPGAAGKGRGTGMIFQDNADSEVPSQAVVRASRIERVHEVGIAVLGADVLIDRTAVSAVAPRAIDEALGDGVSVARFQAPSRVTLTASRIEGAVRAGLSAFGAAAAVAGTTFECDGFDIHGEPYLGQAASFEDVGGNVCGCSGALRPCRQLSVHLSPPMPVP
jgi:hypothetical protein